MVISFSFDDGRDDNYRIAFPIMKKYNLYGTLHITTGYIDGTWSPPQGAWKSAQGPIKLKQLTEMQKSGFEISFHGDKHIMDPTDFESGVKKLQSWGLLKELAVGFSVPNSNTGTKKEFLDTINKKCLYLREGRNPKCYKLSNKVTFALYRLTGSSYFYYFFNKLNCMDLTNINPYSLYSIVVRKEDRAKNMLKFIKRCMNENTWLIFMFHSIHENTETDNKNDAWCWDRKEFEMLCSSLSSFMQQGNVVIKPIREVIQEITLPTAKEEIIIK